jgi:hypothetical protein
LAAARTDDHSAAPAVMHVSLGAADHNEDLRSARCAQGGRLTRWHDPAETGFSSGCRRAGIIVGVALLVIEDGLAVRGAGRLADTRG